MTITLSKSKDEIGQMPLVELTFEILRAKKEPLYFRDLMKEVQALRKMTDDEVNEVIARLYTEINIDGRFTCIGQNVWGLSRWYPVDKATERSSSSKKFVRRSGDAFSEDDEDDEEFDDISADEDIDDSDSLFNGTDDNDAEDADAESGEDEETDDDVSDGEEIDAEFEEEPLAEEDDEDEED